MSDLPLARNGPWWSRATWQVGPVVVGFLVLVGMLIGAIPSPMLQSREMLGRVVVWMGTLEPLERGNSVTLGDLESRVAALQAQHAEEERLLHAICRNTARTEVGREACER